MKSFFSAFSPYDNCVPPGVRLPTIKILNKYYKSLGISEDVPNSVFLKELCLANLNGRGFSDLEINEYKERLTYELETLENLGFTDYILLNWDVINFCHENNIPVGPGRGSAAGSLVLFLIGVTNIDPIQYGLFFERFVSKSRAKKTELRGVTYLDGSLLADIDNDIAYEHRQKVIDYIEEKHPGKTSKILTLNTLSSKLCIRESCKIVSDFSEKDVGKVSDLIPKKFGKNSSLADSCKENPEFLDWGVKNKKIFSIAKKIEGLNKNSGVHPSGIAICFYDIESICPTQSTNDGSIVTAYDMNWVSELMVKFDILGLRTLSVIHDVCNNLSINPEDIDIKSPSLFEPLNPQFCTPHGLFQIEADTNFRVCKNISPKNLEQLSAVIAIARPGALEFNDQYADFVKTGESQVFHEFFNDVLSYTGGIPLYQEQLMKMAVKIGFTLDESEQLRRIVGKKKIDKMPEWKNKIKNKVEENSLDPAIADILWKVAEDSANYSFNKSHSLAYATLAAWTIYLKFKYPQDFFLSLLRMTKFEPSPQEEIRKISTELAKFNMKLLPPDLRKSDLDFAKEGLNIRFGLNSVKGVSGKSLDAIHDFSKMKHVNKFSVFVNAKAVGLNVGILSSLIQAGCLCSYEGSRPLLVLEAQSFNLLTDREKRAALSLGEKYNFKILDIIADSKNGLMSPDGKLFMKESRLKTFKKQYDRYKQIYIKNKKFENFANWYFESKLLGYSYSSELKSVFDESEIIYDSSDFEKSNSVRGKFVGVVQDSMRGISRNNNSYLRLTVSDEKGSYNAIMVDNSRAAKCSDFFAKGGVVPQKDEIISVIGVKINDALFIDNIFPLKEKIYMKLGDLK
jgi:DNA polymerase III subunit alpha